LTVSCGALPSDLMGSELFGHVRGAFTGADKEKTGRFQLADGGTVVLEEIDTLDLIQQAKLLRVLETGEFEPVGSNETHCVNTRVIVTSNVDLDSLVASNRFRADLYFRLSQLKFELPPLRKRLRDIVCLATAMIEQCCRENSLAVRHLHPEFLELLKAYIWPGNIRDLRNEIHRAVLFSRNGVLNPECLSPALVREAQRIREQAEQIPVKPGLALDVTQAEVEAIERMLRAMDFNRAATARALGISRVTLYNKIRKYRIRLDGNPSLSHYTAGVHCPGVFDGPREASSDGTRGAPFRFASVSEAGLWVLTLSCTSTPFSLPRNTHRPTRGSPRRSPTPSDVSSLLRAVGRSGGNPPRMTRARNLDLRLDRQQCYQQWHRTTLHWIGTGYSFLNGMLGIHP